MRRPEIGLPDNRSLRRQKPMSADLTEDVNQEKQYERNKLMQSEEKKNRRK